MSLFVKKQPDVLIQNVSLIIRETNEHLVFALVRLDDRRQLHQKLRLHPEASERDESPETGHEPRRQAPPLPHAPPPQLQQEGAAADRQDLVTARGS